MPSPRLRLIVPREHAYERLDRFLVAQGLTYSRSQIKRCTDEDRIQVNGTPRKAGWKIKFGDEVVFDPPDPEPAGLLPEDLPLDVVHEDRDLIVLSKQPGMVVHPSPGHRSGTLVNALLHHCGDLVGVGGVLRPGIVHRLDKDTSGLMVCSKNDLTHRALALQFKEHTIERRYVAIVRGRPARDEGTFRTLHGRNPKNRFKFTSRVQEGKHAVTRYRVLERFEGPGFAVVEARLETGRTHQVRVHFSENNMPILADQLYGRTRAAGLPEALKQAVEALGRQALHAAVLGFLHPGTDEPIRFETPPPEDMQAVLRVLRGNPS